MILNFWHHFGNIKGVIQRKQKCYNPITYVLYQHSYIYERSPDLNFY